jgi:hypothetical protein
MDRDSQRIRKAMSLLKRRYGAGRPAFLQFFDPMAGVGGHDTFGPVPGCAGQQGHHRFFSRDTPKSRIMHAETPTALQIRWKHRAVQGKSKNIVNSAK